MARPYTNSDTAEFSKHMCRPGHGFSGFIGTGFRCAPDMDPDAGYPEPIVVLRTWYWLDEASGLVGQTNVTNVRFLPSFTPREGEPGHFHKTFFRYPWPQITPARLQDTVRVRRSLESAAPDVFAEYGTTVGAYVLGAGPYGGFNGYLGLPGATEAAVARLPEGAVPPRSQPWALELFIKDDKSLRWGCIPNYDVATGALTSIASVNEQHTDADPATHMVLDKLRHLPLPARCPLPADEGAWVRPGAAGSATRTFVGPSGLVLTEEGLGAEWAPPEVPSGHSLHRLPDAAYLVCPDNLLAPGGAATFEMGVRRLGGGAAGMQRVRLSFDEEGLWREVRHEKYE